MRRLKNMAGLAFFMGCRGLAAIVPPAALYFVLLPYSALRGLRPAMRETHLPASRLPPPADDRPGFMRRWRFQAAIHQRWMPLLWSDRWDQPRWARRFTVNDRSEIERLKATRPIVVVTIHTGAFLVLGGWLMHQGLGIGSIVMGQRAWDRRVRAQARTASIWSRFGDSAAFRPGDTRALLRYLQQGRCLILAPDHMHGHGVEGEWPGGRLRMASGAYRVARLTGAAVLPVVVTDAGRWRFSIHIGAPVPDELIAAEDELAAASHVARELMPIVAARPDQAAITLVGATVP